MRCSFRINTGHWLSHRCHLWLVNISPCAWQGNVTRASAADCGTGDLEEGGGCYSWLCRAVSRVLWEGPPQGCTVQPLHDHTESPECTQAVSKSWPCRLSPSEQSESMSMGPQPNLTSTQHDSLRNIVPGTNAKVLSVPQDLECHSEQLSALWVPRVGKEPGSALMGGCCR